MPPEAAALTLAQLQAESACRALVLQAAALADAGQPEALAALFTAQGRLTRPSGALLQGREAIAAAYRARPPQRLTAHLVFGTLFLALGADEARATSRVLLWTGTAAPDAGAADPADTANTAHIAGRRADARQTVGRFDDHLVRTPEGWRIAERVAVFELHSP